jgi:Secretion system C-terminal sorting domain
MNKKKFFRILFFGSFYCALNSIFAQRIVNGFTQQSFDNVANSYNFTYWDASFKTPVSSRKFTNQASSYNLNVDYNNLNINSLDINSSNLSAAQAFQEANASTFATLQSSTITYKILQNWVPIHEKTATPTNSHIKVCQMVEYGPWVNRRMVDSLNFTNSPSLYHSFSGIEFTNWHNRFKITFHVRPRTTIVNGHLELDVQLPAAFDQTFQSGNIYGFAKSANGAGFAVKGSANNVNVSVANNTITVHTGVTNLNANSSYEVSLIFYAIKNNFSATYAMSDDDQVNITVNQTLPWANNSIATSYSSDEGLHYINVPPIWMGYGNCGDIDRLQNLKLSLANPTANEKRIRLCFRQQNLTPNVTGFSSMLRTPDGNPSGIPLQISKNWHTTYNMLYSGYWIREYTEIIVPAYTILNFDYTCVGGRWGKVYGAFSHQLSVVGDQISRGGWLEAGLGSFGEHITHSPDYELGNSNICDYRPVLVTNQSYGGTSAQCNWTGNVGGMDLFFYNNSANTRIYQSQVKTQFKKYGPNLTETAISMYSSDNKLKLDYTFYLNRSDDFIRVFYKVKLKALENTSFSRFDFFQLGSDAYNFRKAQSVVYGNDATWLGYFTPSNAGSNSYTSAAIPLTGNNPWIWSGDGIPLFPQNGIEIPTNNGIIIRSYQALLGGQVANTPYFRERSGSHWQSLKPTQYCLVPPPSINSFMQGDSIEMLIEAVCLPKQTSDYYGPNTKFKQALTQYGNTWELLFREVAGNKIVASSPTNTINTSYPLTVNTSNNTGAVVITGGIGYVPLVFKGLTTVNDPKLWRKKNSTWEVVNQANYGKDFWQTEYDRNTDSFDLIYNVNQDTTNSATNAIQYYLGAMPPNVLPITLLRFEAEQQEAANLLTWETITEEHNKGFEIERLNSSTWQNIGFKTANNKPSNYQFLDKNPLTTSYYRLRQIDNDGKETLSKVIAIQRNRVKEKLAVYPNPVSNTLNLNYIEEGHFEIINLLGQQVLSGEISPSDARWLDVSALPQGSYFLKMGAEQVKFVKQ